MPRCKVIVRIRPPPNSTEKLAVDWDDTHVYLTTLSAEYDFDRVLDPQTTQDSTFECAAKTFIPDFFAGINCAILAYGQTGSGKTYTIGTDSNRNNRGIIARSLVDIFDRLEPLGTFSEWKHELHATYIELYQEDVIDLLNLPIHPSSGAATNDMSSANIGHRRTSLISRNTLTGSNRIKISQSLETNSIQLSGVKYVPVESVSCALNLLRTGSLHRKTSRTTLNLTSSRSHAIFTLWLKQHNHVQGTTLESKFHFVDLAGSERVKRTHATGNTLREGININSGLLALSNVINGLTSGDQSAHVPYRDSKLTRILQDSLGGNSKTVLIACISPLRDDLSETCSTLKYAGRARNIENKIMINTRKPDTDVRELRQQLSNALQEIQRLNADNAALKRSIFESCEEPTASDKSLLEENKRLQAEICSLKVQLEKMRDKCGQLLEEARQISPSLLIERVDEGTGDGDCEMGDFVVSESHGRSIGEGSPRRESEQLQTDCDRLDCAIKNTSELITGTVVEQGYWEQMVIELSTEIQVLNERLKASEEQTRQLTDKIVELDNLSFAEEVNSNSSADLLANQLAHISSPVSTGNKNFGERSAFRNAGEKSVVLYRQLEQERERAESNLDRIRILSEELEKVNQRRIEAMKHVRDFELELKNLHKEKEQIKTMMAEKEKRIGEKDRIINKLEKETKKLKRMVEKKKSTTLPVHCDRVLEEALQVKLQELRYKHEHQKLDKKRQSVELELSVLLGKITLLVTKPGLNNDDEAELNRLQAELEEQELALKFTQKDLKDLDEAGFPPENPSLDSLMGPDGNCEELCPLLFDSYAHAMFHLKKANEDRQQKQEAIQNLKGQIKQLEEHEQNLQVFYKDQTTKLMLKCNEDKLLYMQLLQGHCPSPNPPYDLQDLQTADEDDNAPTASLRKSNSFPSFMKLQKKAADPAAFYIIQSQNTLLLERVALLESQKSTEFAGVNEGSPKHFELDEPEKPPTKITVSENLTCKSDLDSDSEPLISRYDHTLPITRQPTKGRMSLFTPHNMPVSPSSELTLQRISPPSRELPSVVSYLSRVQSSIAVGMKGELQLWDPSTLDSPSAEPLFQWDDPISDSGPNYVTNVCDMLGSLGLLAFTTGLQIVLTDPRQNNSVSTILNSSLDSSDSTACCHSLCVVRDIYLAAGVDDGTIILFDPRSPGLPMCRVPSSQHQDFSTALTWLPSFSSGRWERKADALSLLQGLTNASSLGVVKLWDEGWTTLPSIHNLGRITALSTLKTASQAQRPRTANHEHRRASTPVHSVGKPSNQISSAQICSSDSGPSSSMAFVCAARDDILRSWIWNRPGSAPKSVIGVRLNERITESSVVSTAEDLGEATACYLKSLSIGADGDWIFTGDSLGRLRFWWTDKYSTLLEQQVGDSAVRWHDGPVNCLTHIETDRGYIVLSASDRVLKYTDVWRGH